MLLSTTLTPCPRTRMRVADYSHAWPHSHAIPAHSGSISATANRHGSRRTHRGEVLAAVGFRTLMTVGFEPTMPVEQLTASAGVLLLTVVTGAYWWLVIVPSERASLAKAKRRGGVRSYLDDLEASPTDERQAERWFYTDWLQQLKQRKSLNAWGSKTEVQAPDSPPATAPRVAPDSNPTPALKAIAAFADWI